MLRTQTPIDARRFAWALSFLVTAALGLTLFNPGLASASRARTSAATERAARHTQKLEERATLRRQRSERRAVRAEERAAHRQARGESAGVLSNPPGDGATGAAEGQSGLSGCQVSIQATALTVTAGEPAGLLGALVCPQAGSAAGQALTVYQRTAGTPGFVAAGTAISEENGSYQFTTAALSSNSSFYVRVGGIRSARVSVKVAAQVTISSSAPNGAQLSIAGTRRDAALANGSQVTFTGTVGPADDGAVVALQRKDEATGEKWRRIALAEVGSDGTYSITHTFRIPGAATVRVVAHPYGRNATAASEPISYEIARRQNPRLTIQASGDPIFAGASVTISGTAVGAPNQPVTLLARVRGGAFAAVGKVTTDGSGNYVFPVQSPLQSTVYRVTGAGTHSVSLLEGVRYVLSVEPSSTSAQAGQQVSFSGTVSPAHAGQSVYLERQNPNGLGFHAIAVGTVGTDSTYSISETFFNAGTAVVRVRVPGDSENLGEASEPITLQVAAASAASLKAPSAPAPSDPEA